MIILAENNAFQNIQKCLDKKCNAVHQIEDFLQFCIQIIFYEKINIAGLVPQYIIQESNETIDLLKEKYKIKIFECEVIKNRKGINEELIARVSQELFLYFDDFIQEYKRLAKTNFLNLFPNLNKESIESISRTTEAINNRDVNFMTGNVQHSSFSTDSGFFKIINTNDGIIDKMFELATTYKWDNNMSLYLLSRIKLMQNKNLAILTKQIYSPSVQRGRDERVNSLVLKQFDEIFRKSKKIMKIADTKKYIGDISMPSLMSYIIKAGKGNVSEMLKISQELRFTFSPVRDYLNKHGGKNNDPLSFGIANEIANRIYETLEQGTLHHSKTVAVENTYASTLGIGGFFTLPVLIRDKQTINRYKELDLCVVAFTEVIGRMIESSKDDFTKKLISNCGVGQK